MNIVFSLVLGLGLAARSLRDQQGRSLSQSHVSLLRRGSQLPILGVNSEAPNIHLVNATGKSNATLESVGSQILSTNHTGYAGNASSRNIYCTLKPRVFPSLPDKFLSSTPPFEEPGADDYLNKKTGGGTTFLMRQVDVDVLQKRKWMLNKIVALLNTHQITYWLEAGTLLGAYRSHAFMPWDDDIDLAIPIAFQKKLMGPVKMQAAKLGISIHQLYFPPGNPYYKPLGTYIRHHAPRVAPTTAGNATWGTLGYFCQAHYQGLKLDLWQAIPVQLDGKVMYSTGVSGTALFSRADVFPLRQLKFEGQSYPVPHRTHRYLVAIYDDITMPPWQHWYDPYTCTWNVLHTDLKKKPRDTKSKYFATITFDSNLSPHMDVPESVMKEVDSPKNFKKYQLGGQDAVTSDTPSGYGYSPFQLAR